MLWFKKYKKVTQADWDALQLTLETLTVFMEGNLNSTQVNSKHIGEAMKAMDRLITLVEELHAAIGEHCAKDKPPEAKRTCDNCGNHHSRYCDDLCESTQQHWLRIIPV